MTIVVLHSDNQSTGQECGKLILIGMGLWDHEGMSLSGITAAKSACDVFVELYTSVMPGLRINCLEKMLGKRVTVLKRRDLEEDADRKILASARNHKVALLVPGDPLVATTHITLRLRACELGIRTELIHGASITSAAASYLGLQHHKFGRTVTIPFPQEVSLPLSAYDSIADNLSRGLHTLVLLDLDAEKEKYLSIGDALSLLLRMEATRKIGAFDEERYVVGIARIGSPKPTVKCGHVRDVASFDFGSPPYSIVVPGALHFMEAETLVKLFGAPPSLLKVIPPANSC